jgi:hypothetical protein
LATPQSKRWTRPFPQLCIGGNHFPGKPVSWRERASCDTEDAGDRGPRPLPDFYIGAHAAIGHLALLTRDAARYQSYFPTIEVLAPAERRM